MKKSSSRQLTAYRRLQRSTEWLTKVFVWDAQNGYPLSTLFLNLVLDFGNWSQMCIDILTAYIEYRGYIIPQ